MNKLHEVKLTSTLQVQVSCSLNEEILDRNFSIILECLQQLSSNQQKLQSAHLEINNLKQELANIKTTQQTNNHQSNINQTNTTPSDQHHPQVYTHIKQIQHQIQNHQQHLDTNIKDINLINKNLQDLNQLIHSLNKNNTQESKHHNNSNNHSISLDDRINVKFNQLKKEIQKNNHHLKQHSNAIHDIQNNIQHINQNLQLRLNTNNNTQQQVDNKLDNTLLESLKDRIDALNKKIAIITNDINNNSQNIVILKDQTNYLSKDNEQLRQGFNGIKEDIEIIKNKLQGLIKEKQTDLKSLKSQLSKVKKNQNSTTDNITVSDKKQKANSNTSLDDNVEQKNNLSNNLNKNALYTQNRFLNRDDDIKQLKQRVQNLEKMIYAKKNLIQEKTNTQKLPMIRKSKHHNGEALEKLNNNNKKDLLELKLEIQSWAKSYIDNQKDKQSYGDLQLMIQQIKNLLNKKADQQGMKKGLTFLETKINQLYLFLTEPDTEDAMIVRKGFNCLSCSKKVEKLRGRLGPHINWNNMTSTNYSPPRVGYSKPLGQNSLQKQSQK